VALLIARNIPNTDIEIEQYVQIKAFRFDLPSGIYLELQAKQSEKSDGTIEEWDEPMALADIGKGVKGDITMGNLYLALKKKYDTAKDV